MNKTKKRSFTALLCVLVCALALVLSLGILSACGSDESATVDESASGSTWYYGDKEPAEDLGKAGDFYLNTETLASYVKEGKTWRIAADGEAGSWYYGTSAPLDTIGEANDLYLNTKTGELYQKSASGWGSPVLVLKGEKGRDGVVWFSGNKAPTEYEEGDPTLKDAQPGDFYLNTDGFDVYQLKADRTWDYLGSIKGEEAPRGTLWFMGTTEPSGADLSDAREGDFYFRNTYIDDAAKAEKYQIYRFESGEWRVKVSVIIKDLSAFYEADGTSHFSDNGRTVTVTGAADGVTDLTIPGELNGKPVAIGESAFANSSLRSVTIEEGVTSVGKNAFKNCTDLTDVTWNAVNGGNQATGSGQSIFSGCSALESVTFGENVEMIPKYTFYGCSGLKNVTFNDKLTTIGYYAFRGCTNLSDVTLPESLTTLEDYAFYGCKALTEITIPASVNRLGSYAFDSCDHITSVTINAGSQLQDLSSIGAYTFENCTSLSRVSIGEGVGAIGKRMFYKCTALQSITIPDGVEEIGELAFSGSGLTEITIGSGVQTIGVNAFQNCTSLASVTFGKSVSSIGSSAFDGCSALATMNVDGENGTFKAEQNCVIEKDTNRLVLGCKSSVIPAGVESIGAKAFYKTEIENVVIPASVTAIEESAFEECKSLTTLSFASENCALATIGKRAFINCENLGGSIAIPDSVTTVGSQSFSGCKNLTGVTLGSGITVIAERVFNGCTSLASVTLGSGVQSIGDYAFDSCAFTSITIPASVTSVSKSAFHDCNSLTSITFGGTTEQWKALEEATHFVTSYLKSTTVTVTCTAEEGGGEMTYVNGVLQG